MWLLSKGGVLGAVEVLSCGDSIGQWEELVRWSLETIVDVSPEERALGYDMGDYSVCF